MISRLALNRLANGISVTKSFAGLNAGFQLWLVEKQHDVLLRAQNENALLSYQF